MDTDQALADLKKLREGRGLSADRLANYPALLAALGTSDPGEAYQALRLILERLGDSDRTRALKADFGLDLEDLLQRSPSGRERDYLGERRSGFAGVVGRDVKTLARWSDRTLAELRAQLITDQFDGQVVVAAGVKDRRLAGIEVMRYEKEDEHLSSGRNIGYTNPEPGPSLPMVLYGFPRDWRPQSIRFAIAFMDDDYPKQVWALAADSVLDVSFGHERFELEIDDGMVRCRIDNPRRDQLYGVWWEW